MPNNDKLKEIINNAKLIFAAVFQRIATTPSSSNTKVIALKTKLNKQFSRFDDPNFWIETIDYDKQMLWHNILVFESVNINSVEEILKAGNDYFTFVDTNILKSPTVATAKVVTSDWNVRTINALGITDKSILERKTFFKNKGEDLSQNAMFSTAETAYTEDATHYTALLKSNKVNSKESDIKIIKMYGVAISKIVLSDNFTTMYKALDGFIKTKIAAHPKTTNPAPAPTEPPVAGTVTPNLENGNENGGDTETTNP